MVQFVGIHGWDVLGERLQRCRRLHCFSMAEVTLNVIYDLCQEHCVSQAWITRINFECHLMICGHEGAAWEVLQQQCGFGNKGLSSLPEETKKVRILEFLVR